MYICVVHRTKVVIDTEDDDSCLAFLENHRYTCCQEFLEEVSDDLGYRFCCQDEDGTPHDERHYKEGECDVCYKSFVCEIHHIKVEIKLLQYSFVGDFF